ncbi:DUF6364 family protein [Membranihabitans maritimus]|uniref:DUF6364 family protein n=1 Tax=Membranihabitans maritimus TaxID=2904244 RepID=UPI001F2D4A99|nr:DUF6364 family protein [Membranihabitans maritimus]
MSNTKLTLNINEEIIVKEKPLAKHHKISLSKMVEHYLSCLSKQAKGDTALPGWIKELPAVKKNNSRF